MGLIPTLSAAAALLFATVGAVSYHVSYIDNSPYWGIPYHTTRDAEGALAVSRAQESVESRLAALPASIARRRRDILALADQQRYLYNKLFNATTDLEKNSNLDLSLLERIGPMANLYLRDLTNTDEAMLAVAEYEAALPPASPVRGVLGELRSALSQEPKSKSEFLEKITEWRQQEYEAAAERSAEESRRESARLDEEFRRLTRPELTPQPPAASTAPIEAPRRPTPEVDGYQDPNHVEAAPEELPEAEVADPEPGEPEPAPEEVDWRTATTITGKDSDMLGAAHKIMADIHITQARMVEEAKGLVQEYRLLESYSQQLAAPRPEPTLMFVRDRTADVLEVGLPLYECGVGFLLCERVGTVTGVTGQRAEAPSPTSGKMQPGFLVTIELTSPSAGRGKLIHIHEPPTR